MTQPSSQSLTSKSQIAKNPETEVFKKIMHDSGIKLSSNEDPNVLTQEQALVVRDIDKLLEDDSNECIDRFLQGFKILIKKERYLKKALMPTLFKNSTNRTESDVEIQQESLFR
jgi:hypothetical protein